MGHLIQKLFCQHLHSCEQQPNEGYLAVGMILAI